MLYSRGDTSRRAFTLVEILVVVTIIGIAGAIVIPHLMEAGTLGVQAASRMVIADILFAQNDAIAAQNSRRVVFDVANNRYWLTTDLTFALNTVPAPGNAMGVNWKGGPLNSNFIFDFDTDERFDGVILQNVNFGGNTTLEFDALGGPTSGGTLQLVSGNNQYQIDVAPFTGRVTVARLP